jgi:hypothetical protein
MQTADFLGDKNQNDLSSTDGSELTEPEVLKSFTTFSSI